MVKGIEQAVAALKQDPQKAVTAEVDGIVVEIRYKGRRSADDIFREVGPWEGESGEEISREIQEARRQGGSKEAPSF